MHKINDSTFINLKALAMVIIAQDPKGKDTGLTLVFSSGGIWQMDSSGVDVREEANRILEGLGTKERVPGRPEDPKEPMQTPTVPRPGSAGPATPA